MIGPINIRDLERRHDGFIKLHDQNTELSLAESGQAALGFVKTKPGFDRQTGRTQAKTKAKIIRRRGRAVALRVSNSAKHAAVLEKGSAPHRIRAKQGKALRFWGFGKLVFRKSVQHPGTKPYRFLSRARNRAGIEFERSMKPRMIRAARNF